MIQSISFFKSPDDILASYNSDFNSDEAGFKNTWDDWHILASSRPVFVPPTVKTNYVDIPGMNGSLDLSEALTKYPTYNNRSGTFKFRVMNDYVKDDKIIYESNDVGRWAQRYSEIMDYLHGKSLYAVLADDPMWFYHGRFTVDSWETSDTWSEITIGYDVNPFKWSISTSISEWLWNPFNFENGVIRDVVCKDLYVNNVDDFGNSIKIPPYTLDGNSMTQFFGAAPISPTVTFVPECPNHHKKLESVNGILQCPETGCGNIDAGLDIRFVNTYLGIDYIKHIKGGTTFIPDFVFYGQATPYELYFKGCGTVSLDFRVGRL